MNKREIHERNLASEMEMMWSFDGVNYWRLGGRLYARRNRSDEERFAGNRNARFRPWTDEERREVARVVWALRGITVAALLCDAVVLWLAFRGG